MTLPPPPDDLRSFYEAERVAPTLMDVDAQARILERVRIVADIAAPAATTAAIGVGVKTLIAVAALSFAAGGVVGHVATRDAGVEPRAPEVAEADIELEAPVVDIAVPEEPAIEDIEDVADIADIEDIEDIEDIAPSPPVEAESEARQDLSRERRLLDSATAAIAREHWSEADRALARHGRVFPRGALVEEREALRVRVAFEDGRYEAAAGLAQRFLSRFSGSLYAPRVRLLLQRARERAHSSSPAQ